MLKRFALAAALAAFISASAVEAAADVVTVTSLLSDGYTVVSSFFSQIGPGLFLEKGASLYLCFVEEKPDTPSLKTIYCKPVE